MGLLASTHIILDTQPARVIQKLAPSLIQLAIQIERLLLVRDVADDQDGGHGWPQEKVVECQDGTRIKHSTGESE